MYKNYNANPKAHRGDDCTVRAISKALRKSWAEVYIELCMCGLEFCDMPTSNYVWGHYLIKQGYKRHIIPNTCPSCYTVKDFTREHNRGTYILALHGHVVAVIDGDYYDTWDSGDEVPLYYWKKED